MTNPGRMRALLAVGALACLVVACVDAPSGVSQRAVEDPLAETFDALSRESSMNGDIARGDGFAFAALSVRHGVVPSRLEVRNGGQVETYDAFVTAAAWESSVPASIRPVTRRTLVAWRRTAESSIRVLSLLTPNDSAHILSPLGLGPALGTMAVYAGASAMLHEGKDGPDGKPDLSSGWYGTAGWVKLREVQTGSVCGVASASSTASAGVKCQQARFLSRFDVTMQRLTGRPVRLVTGLAPRQVTAVAETAVNGLKLTFSCVSPSGDKGCR